MRVSIYVVIIIILQILVGVGVLPGPDNFTFNAMLAVLIICALRKQVEMTIEFGEDSMLDWKLLDKEDAPFFICFLEVENDRHRQAIKDAKYEQIYYKNDHLMWKLWQNAIHRHVEDVEFTKVVIQEVRHYFGMEEI